MRMSPFDHAAGPGEAAAENDHENVIARLDSTTAVGFIERDRHSRGRCIAVSIEIHIKLFQWNAETIRNCLDDAKVRLVRNDASDVMDRQARLFEGLFGRAQHGGDRLFVNFLPGHVNGCEIQIDLVARDWAPRTATRHKQDVAVLAVAADVSADDTVTAASVS